MKTITLRVYKDEVTDEVAKVTDYTWAKLPDAGEEARERILAADEDVAEMDRAWDEIAAAVTDQLKEMIDTEVAGEQARPDDALTSFTPQLSQFTPQSPAGSHLSPIDTPLLPKRPAYEARLRMSELWDSGLKGSVETALRGFMVNSLVARWFMYSNKEEAPAYQQMADAEIKKALSLLYSRRRPKRLIINDSLRSKASRTIK